MSRKQPSKEQDVIFLNGTSEDNVPGLNFFPCLAWSNTLVADIRQQATAHRLVKRPPSLLHELVFPCRKRQAGNEGPEGLCF